MVLRNILERDGVSKMLRKIIPGLKVLGDEVTGTCGEVNKIGHCNAHKVTIGGR